VYVLLPVWYSDILKASSVCNLYATGIALYLGSLDILLQILKRNLKKDLRRELKKVLL